MSKQIGTVVEVQSVLDDLVTETYYDPLKFVLGFYPWGKKGGPLEHETGPDKWQADFLTRLGAAVKARAFDGYAPVKPIRMAVSKGHGVGGSTLAAWLVDWIMSTRPQSKGTITANTFTQLETKTWAAIRTWHKRCETRDWFTVTSTKMYHTSDAEAWFCTPQSSKEENSEAFAGQHEKRVLPDEALVVGADLAWGGEDRNIFRFRRGLDARSIPPICIPGSSRETPPY